MYAIIETKGKQYKVTTGDKIKIEKTEAKKGEQIEFNNLLFLEKDGGYEIGKPQLSNAKVIGEVIRQDREKKIIVFKKKRRKNYNKIRGHRQYFTEVKILDIREN